VNGLEIAAAGATSATGTAVGWGDASPSPAGVSALGVAAEPPLEVEVATGWSDSPGGVAGRAVLPGGVVAVGVGIGVGDDVGRAVGVGVGVELVHVPAGDTGGGSAPASGSYRKPTSSPSPSVAFDTPCAELVHAPPWWEMKNTQYDPEAGRHDV
jgi:hypothetical protein